MNLRYWARDLKEFVYSTEWDKGDGVENPHRALSRFFGHAAYYAQDGIQLGMGRNDKTGREIYEGDIVEVENGGGLLGKFVVKFGRVERTVVGLHGNVYWPVEINGFYFESKDGKPCFSITKNFNGGHDLEVTKVVGHIYQ
jgi:uncharacterized phage protein (TIGR01671 family)